MKRVLLLAVVMAAEACRPTRAVKVGWDPPHVAPDGYRILIDDRVVQDIPPPPLDRRCNCLTATVRVPAGRHTVSVVAYDRGGTSRPSASVVVQ